MPNLTSNFSYNKPLVNNATDADLWGGQLNTNWDDLDADLPMTTATKNADFNVGATEFNYTYLIDASGGTVTATLPAASSVFNGFVVSFKATDVSNTVTIDGNGSETIDGSTTVTITAANGVLTLVCDGTNWRIVSFSDQASTDKRGVVELLTNAEFNTGTDSVRAMVASNFVKSIAASGHITFPGGFIIQWGSVPATNTGTITFDIAFTTSCDGITATAFSAGTAAPRRTIGFGNVTTSDADFDQRLDDGSNSATTWSYIAWGR